MTHQLVPRLLFVGAGNIAQSIMKGILKAQPDAARQILATAPTTRNLNIIREKLGCQISLLKDVRSKLPEFNPEFVFICVKPQVLISSISKPDALLQLLSSVPHKCIMLSLLAGIKSQVLATTLNLPERNVVRLMLNTAAELGATSVFYHPHPEIDPLSENRINGLFQLIGRPTVRLNDESLMHVATGVCGSGIAFAYEFIQAMSDISVKNGVKRDELTQNANRAIIEACEVLLFKQVHPYQVRDDVTLPAGSTVHGLAKWHELSINHLITRAFQASIQRSISLSSKLKSNIENELPDLMIQAPKLQSSKPMAAVELKTASKICHTPSKLDAPSHGGFEESFQFVNQPSVKLTDETMKDIATVVCDSGIAFACEFIQAMSDVGVKNGFTRSVATQNAAQVMKAACEMLLIKQVHPYQARDEVTSQGGTTIYGLDKWHELSVNHQIGRAFQFSINHLKRISAEESNFDPDSELYSEAKPIFQ